ncbi:MAG: MBL fold metallo-hydrolase [candidate division NC10 bacterium]|nr:MBL fold metallo-hydrolase [candidate division NC10 bacterium]
MSTIEFLGGVGTVTGSKFLVEARGRRLLVDCGLYQGLKELRLRNWERLPVDPATIDWVVLTHGHIDHSGYLPRLFKDGFHGRVYATRATADLVKILLPDSGHLQEEEAGYHNKRGTSKHKPALPLYTAAEGLKAATRVAGVGYQEPVELASGIRVWFQRAGHILGSAIVTVEIGDANRRQRLVFSGDLGRQGAPILPDPMPIQEADYVIVESTYGDRRHDPEPIPAQLERVITEAVERGGAIIIPAFAIGRTQELMYHLNALERVGRVPRLPTYVDSPMAIEATEIYCAHPEDFDGDMRAMVMNRNCPLHCGDFRLVRTSEESKAINAIRGPILIIAASGMATGGRVLHHLRLRLPDPRTTVLLVGYQAEGTRGRLLQDGAKSLKIYGEGVPVRAHVETVHGLSAHADAEGLVCWLRTAPHPPKRVFVVHGDAGPAGALAARVMGELGWEATIPGYRDRLVIDSEKDDT